MTQAQKRERNGESKTFRNTIAAMVVAACISEAVFILHSMIDLRERMAMVEAKIDLILYDKGHNPKPDIQIPLPKDR